MRYHYEKQEKIYTRPKFKADESGQGRDYLKKRVLDSGFKVQGSGLASELFLLTGAVAPFDKLRTKPFGCGEAGL